MVLKTSVLGASAGGREEALGHYEDALRAVFELQLDCYRHIQPYRSTKDGNLKWASVEMWPMPVGVRHLLPLTSRCASLDLSIIRIIPCSDPTVSSFLVAPKARDQVVLCWLPALVGQQNAISSALCMTRHGVQSPPPPSDLPGAVHCQRKCISTSSPSQAVKDRLATEHMQDVNPVTA